MENTTRKAAAAYDAAIKAARALGLTDRQIANDPEVIRTGAAYAKVAW